MKFKRIFLLVLDSLGVGEAIDAENYGDSGANTLKHVMDSSDLFIPNLKKLGFLNTLTLNENKETDAYYTVAKPVNKGKDTLSGHYELMGIKTDTPFRTFPQGFPRELITQIETVTGRRVIGNKVSSTEAIIKELGERQVAYGSLIIYTSSESVLEVAAHEKVIPIEQLYKYCEIIRKITLKDEWKVGRVVARPFLGNSSDKFRITNHNKDFALKPPMKSVLTKLKDNNLSVISIGKIYDIFDGEGITKKITSDSNKEAIDKLLDIMNKNFTGLCFVNLNDFDYLYGHRKDPIGYARAIEEFDVSIPMILNNLNNDDLLIITADHGNDPTMKNCEHTRENVPVILYSRVFTEQKVLPVMNTLADVGTTIAENFDLDKPIIGISYLNELK